MNRVEEAIRNNKGEPLLGVATYTCAPEFVEIAAHLGYDLLWIEMEHQFTTFREAANLCRIASGMGLLTMIRIPDARRENVLKAAECGPDIIDLPMANTPEIVEELVRHARFTPEGSRGLFGASRAVRYSMFGAMAEEERRVNEQLFLMAQIETREAVERADELCSVPGLNAIFIGPADLSASLGIPGQMDHPCVIQAAERAISIAKAHGKRVAVPGPAREAAFWTERGVDILIIASDTMCLKNSAQAFLDEARKALQAP